MALSISRRSFMKCVGITAFATATGTLMTGCAQGPATGEFGVAKTVTEGAETLATITVNNLRSTSFNIGINDLLDLAKINFDIPFNPSVSMLTGWVCTMPSAYIQSNSKMLFVLPYFTDEQLDTVVDKWILPNLDKYEDKILEAAEKYMKEHEDSLRETIKSELGKLLEELGSFIPGLTASSSEVSPLFSIEDILSGLITADLKNKFIDAVKSLLEGLLDDASDLLRILMVQARFDGKSGESDLEVALNAGAAAYAFDQKMGSPMLGDPINAGDSVADGVLPLCSNKNWGSLILRFVPRKLSLQFDLSGYNPNWNDVWAFVVAAFKYIILKESGVDMIQPLYNLLRGAFDCLEDISVEDVAGSSAANFALSNGTSLYSL